LQRFTGEWTMLLQPEAILTVCREIGYTAWRDRVLTPVTTMQLFLLQILHGNTACSHLPHLSGMRFTAAAYCQARARLPVRFFDLLLERFSRAVQRSAEALEALPDSLVLREVRYHLDTPGFRTRQITLVTTLLDAESYRVADLAELYHQRWQVETSLAHLKTTMQMDVLHCKTVSGVLKELTVFAIVYNLVRIVMWHSARLQHLDVERIRFLDALRWLSAPSTGIP
jgi:hypothetical protein